MAKTSARQWYEIKAAAEADAADVFIYGDIGESWWGDSVTATQFVRDLQGVNAKKTTFRINSFGGSVTDGIAIFNAIRRHPGEKIVAIDGMAASIASLIAMAGDRVEMAENALMMVHAPWAGAVGNSKDLRDMADTLDKFASAMASSYAWKSGKPVDEVLALLTDGVDHWYDAAEAVAAGFADEVTAAVEVSASFDLSRFAGLPQAASRFIKPAPQPEATAPVAAPLSQLVSVPAAPAAAQSENDMTVQNAAAQDDVVAKARDEALKAEAKRRADVKAVFSKWTHVEGADAVIEACLDDMTVTPDVARERLLAHISKDAQSISFSASVVVDERDNFRQGIWNALLARAGLEKDQTANQYRGYSLTEIARASLEKAGVRTAGKDKMSVVAAAFTHSTSDFPTILENIANKSMLRGYEEANETFQLFTRPGSLPDFKIAKRVDLGHFPSLSKVAEGAEYSYATVGERGETIALATYGKMFSMTRQMVINDDLNAFTMLPRKMGRAAIRTIGDMVYAVLTDNPVMSDGTQLFHANHGNLISSGAGAPSTAQIDKMRTAMALQSMDNVHALNIDMRYVIVPRALAGLAELVRTNQFAVGANANTTDANYVANTFQVITDARLDASSPYAYYGAADPNAFDTIEVAYLDGNQAPVMEQQTGWHVDGVEMKVRIDAGVKALDFRTLIKNNGD